MKKYKISNYYNKKIINIISWILFTLFFAIGIILIIIQFPLFSAYGTPSYKWIVMLSVGLLLLITSFCWFLIRK